MEKILIITPDYPPDIYGGKELAEMVNQIRRLEQILGDGEKRLSSSELEIKKKLRG